jgi:hypothetical protein
MASAATKSFDTASTISPHSVSKMDASSTIVRSTLSPGRD